MEGLIMMFNIFNYSEYAYSATVIDTYDSYGKCVVRLFKLIWRINILTYIYINEK